MTKDLYGILELEPKCTMEDIKRSYKRLVLKYHPDKTDGSYEHFIDIQNAYEILSDTAERERYDLLNNTQKIELYDAFKYYIKQIVPNFDNYVKLFFKSETGLRDNLGRFNFNEIFNQVINRISHIDFPQDLNIYDTISVSLADKLCNKSREIVVNRQTKPTLTTNIHVRDNIVVIEAEGEYNEYLNRHGDVVINIDISDDRYTIVGNDIYARPEISLYEYLYGGVLSLPHPDGDITVEFTSFVDKFPLITVHDRGMYYNSECKRGDLLLALQIRDLSAIKDQIKNLCNM